MWGQCRPAVDQVNVAPRSVSNSWRPGSSFLVGQDMINCMRSHTYHALACHRSQVALHEKIEIYSQRMYSVCINVCNDLHRHVCALRSQQAVSWKTCPTYLLGATNIYSIYTRIYLTCIVPRRIRTHRHGKLFGRSEKYVASSASWPMYSICGTQAGRPDRSATISAAACHYRPPTTTARHMRMIITIDQSRAGRMYSNAWLVVL